MLLFSKSHSNLNDIQRKECGELFSILLNQHYRRAKPVFDILEQKGIFLGNGCFAVAAVLGLPLFFQIDEKNDMIVRLAEMCEQYLTAPFYYGVNVDGVLHIILCYPRSEQTAQSRDEIETTLYDNFSQVLKQLFANNISLRILIGDVFFGEAELFLAANSLHHAMEYDDFRTEKRSLVQLNAEQQLHGAFVEDFYVYQRLANQAFQQLISAQCDIEMLSNSLVDHIIQNSSASMESIHHHIQMFLLTFTERLSSSGLIDATYIQQHQIVRRAMAFETEDALRQMFQTLMLKLHEQYHVLTAVGKQQQMQKIRQYVEQHIADNDLSVNLLAEKFSISPSQLTKQFRRYFADSLHQFIQKTRLETAKRLIAKHPDWPLQKIGTVAGYIDSSTMYRAFKKYDGVSPGVLKHRTTNLSSGSCSS